MADIVLIQPVIGDYDKFKSHPEIPLGLLSASVFLCEEYDVKIIDTRTERNWKAAVLHELSKQPLFVGVTCMIGKPISCALEISRFVKEKSDIPVVWGGPGPTALPEASIQHALIDAVVIGEGEYTLKEYADALRNNKSFKGLQGLWYKENGLIVRNEGRPFCDLNELPQIPYHLVEIDHYKVLRQGIPFISMETSRGCPYNCKFCCNSHINKHKWRAMTAEKALDCIEYAFKHLGVRGLYFCDDNFFVDMERLRAIFNGLLTRNLTIKYELQGARVDSLDRLTDDDVQLLADSGCQKLAIGMESGSQKVLDSINKRYKVEQVIRVNQRFRNHDIVMAYNIIAGFPDESPDDLRATINIMLQLLKENRHAQNTGISCLLIHPSTQLFDEYKDQIKSNLTLEDMSDLDYENALYPWLNRQQKKELQTMALASYFVDNKVRDYVASPIIRAFALVYKPFALWRFRNMYFKIPIEIFLRKLMSFFYKQ